MAGLVPAIHVFGTVKKTREFRPPLLGTWQAMTSSYPSRACNTPCVEMRDQAATLSPKAM
jgi:hypothetical protein